MAAMARRRGPGDLFDRRYITGRAESPVGGSDVCPDGPKTKQKTKEKQKKSATARHEWMPTRTIYPVALSLFSLFLFIHFFLFMSIHFYHPANRIGRPYSKRLQLEIHPFQVAVVKKSRTFFNGDTAIYWDKKKLNKNFKKRRISFYCF